MWCVCVRVLCCAVLCCAVLCCDVRVLCVVLVNFFYIIILSYY